MPDVEQAAPGQLHRVQVALKLDRAGTRKHPFLRTPRKCPRSGKWKFVYLPRYEDPYGVQRSTHSVRCRRD